MGPLLCLDALRAVHVHSRTGRKLREPMVPLPSVQESEAWKVGWPPGPAISLRLWQLPLKEKQEQKLGGRSMLGVSVEPKGDSG